MDQSDDSRVYATISNILTRLSARAKSLGKMNDYIYMNYASQFEDVISSYGADNKARLKSIAEKYDPTGVFQTLQPGYFKHDHAPVPNSGYYSGIRRLFNMWDTPWTSTNWIARKVRALMRSSLGP